MLKLNHRISNMIILPFVMLLFSDPPIEASPSSKAHMQTRTLLESARQEIVSSGDGFIDKATFDILITKLAILESYSDLQTALSRARSIENPFYSSLAIGGIAAIEISLDLNLSTTLFREALDRSLKVTHWTNLDATSLTFLFQLLSDYPSEQGVALLAASNQAFDEWDVSSDIQKEDAMFALSEATILIAPSEAENLLFHVALKSNHYYASIEYLAAFLASRSLEQTLQHAVQHYQARTDWPNDQYFLRAVLIELSKTDFARAFQKVKKMRDLDKEITAVKFAEYLLKMDRRKEAQEVITYTLSLESKFNPENNWTKISLERLQEELKESRETAIEVEVVTSQMIDDFIHNSNTEKLRSIINRNNFVFRNEQQVNTFIQKALPVAKTFPDSDPLHNSPRSIALGHLVVCSAMIGKIDQAVEIAKNIHVPELRISYLLDAYETAKPLPLTVSGWPIHLWQQKFVSIKENCTDMEKSPYGSE